MLNIIIIIVKPLIIISKVCGYALNITITNYKQAEEGGQFRGAK